ncbi:hypothetical protein BDM02DRAFT_2684189 [Thelephora ganbajun]|uniref:Uncharacterized protein n=1 Tax=Thelephora ganbajun TaxID=370292 RepID=A0ACB6ZD51_THEGA|nr:hypothetical protein BDM02DRAFT_2684189 [Thelephora ganbajun]
MTLGSQRSAPLGPRTACPGVPYWLEKVTQRGSAAHNLDPTGYEVIRDVESCGDKGSSVTDDTRAIL